MPHEHQCATDAPSLQLVSFMTKYSLQSKLTNGTRQHANLMMRVHTTHHFDTLHSLFNSTSRQI